MARSFFNFGFCNMLNEMNKDLSEGLVKKRNRKKQDVHFANVDLEIWSKTDLQDLIDDLGENVLILFHDKFKNGNILASLEISYNEIDYFENIEPEKILGAFCSLIENLPKKSRKIWDKSYEKIFVIGFESGNTEKSFQTDLSLETLKRIYEIGASVRITIYPVLNYTIESKETA